VTTASGLEERTAPAVRSSFLRRIASFPVMIAALLTLLAVLTVRDRFSDPDMWWHMRTGQIIWTTHTIPRIDLFSWTTNHHACVPHEWLSQLIIYGAYRWGGYRGLMLFLCAAVAALLIAGYLLCSLYSGNAKVSLLGALVIWFFATSGMAIRPQMIGYLLLIVELLIVHLGSTGSPRWFFCLPPLFALWVNCHGSFLLGFFIACLLLVCSFFHFETTGVQSFPWTAPARRTCALALALSLAAMFLNPVGIRQILYPFDTMLHQPLNTGLVEEWRPLLLTSPRGIGLLLVFVCILFFAIERRSKLFLHEILLLAIGTWLALSHQRMSFVFGILAAPIVSRLLSCSWDGYEPERDLPIANAVLITAALLIAGAALPSRAHLLDQIRKQNPVAAVEYIHTHHLSGRMLNDWGSGGYLIWAAPDHPVFIDGRGDVFEWTGVMTDFGNWAMLQSDPRTLLEKYQIDFCLLASNAPMSHVMPLLPGWKLEYADNTAIIFVRDRSQ
jgi:hypothetical protein